MKDNKYLVFVILAVVIAFSLASIAANNTYDRVELRMFNEINGTQYTLPQWRIYEYDIKKLYPFVGQRKDGRL